MNLPSSLASWTQYLTIFPDETSFTVGKMAQRISPLIGSLQTAAQMNGGEPDGYDGLTRRGYYNRLLLSEMALADEMPDEFLRRAAMSEHLFLQLARVEPSSARISVALFDAGAEQLGEPRLAHLAILIVLQRRAALAKAKFKWGVMQDGDLRLFDEVNAENTMHLLNSRTAQIVTGDIVQKWRVKFAEIASVDDVWLTGSPRLAAVEAAKGFSHLSVTDPLDPAARQLNLSVCSASGAQKSLTLNLPEPKTCTRLLRNPFETVSFKTQSADFELNPAGNLLFNDEGSKLFALLNDGRVGCFNVPNSENAELATPKKYRHYSEPLVAVGSYRKTIALFTFKNEMLHVSLAKKGKARIAPGEYPLYDSAVKFKLPSTSDTLLQTFHLWQTMSHRDYEVVIMDADRTLFRLHQITSHERNNFSAAAVGKLNVLATRVLAAAGFHRNFVFVGCEPERETPLIVSFGEKAERRDVPMPETPTRAFIGYGSQAAHKTFGLIGLKGDSDLNWAVVTNAGDLVIPQSPDAKVVGVFQEPRFKPEAGLIELEEDNRTFTFNCHTHRKPFYTAKSAVTSVVLSHRSPLMALQTVDGEIIVYSFTHRTEICRYRGTPEEV